MSKYNIEELEKVDIVLIRHILNAHSKTSLEWLYADTGKLDLKSLIQTRRMMYLWHILSRKNGELIHKSVFGLRSNDINTALYHFSLLSDIL